MNRLKISVIVGVTALFLVACSEPSSTTTGQVQQDESKGTSQMAKTATDETTEIDGILTQTEKGLAVVSDTDTYLVAGQDLSDMVGKKVKITGAVAKSDDGQVIQVMSVIPLE